MNKQNYQSMKPYKHMSSYYRKVKMYMQQNKKQTIHQNNLRNFQRSTFLPTASTILSTSTITLPSSDESVFTSFHYHEEHYEKNAVLNEFNNDDICDETTNNIIDEDEKVTLVTSLKNWALKNHIKHTALNELLVMLSTYGIQNLPKDSRTLLSTPRMVNIQPMGTGEFWYYGIELSLVDALYDIDQPTNLLLTVNIDGLPISRSSKQQFWPILVSIANKPHITPMAVALYSGDTKPPSAAQFLQHFVDELKLILAKGVIINSLKISVQINAFICDTPARCFVKGIVSYNAYNSCNRCLVEGEYHHSGRHMSFPQTCLPLRTDENFRNKHDPEHHQKNKITGECIPSPLEQLPIDMIKDVIIADSLHLIDLGIMKRCLHGWVRGSFNFKNKFFIPQVNSISLWLHNSNLNIPSEIHRSVRGLDCLSFWKGLEFRSFLLYLGPVILKNHLDSDTYEHFLLLFAAITICSTNYYITQNLLPLAERLLIDYIEKFISTYGIDSISSNVHNLCHLVEDVKRFGCLTNTSSYPFENHLQMIKNVIRTGNRPLAQAAKRLQELSKVTYASTFIKQYPSLKHEIGELNQLPPGYNRGFKTLHLFDGMVLAATEKNQWFLTKQTEIVKFQCAYYCGNQIIIYGCSLIKLNNFFECPFPSRNLNVYLSNKNFKISKSYNLSDIKCKMVCLEYDGINFVFLPLLHTLDLCNK